jgi:hypothetical protein
MNKSQILNNRSFDELDGDRYMVVIHTDNFNKVFIEKKKCSAILSYEFKSAKTFKNKATANKIRFLLISNGHTNFTILQVKDIFEPRYYIKFMDVSLLVKNPHIKHYQDWYIKGENPVNTYLDKGEAQVALDKCKLTLLEFYYRQILELKNITI